MPRGLRTIPGLQTVAVTELATASRRPTNDWGGRSYACSHRSHRVPAAPGQKRLQRACLLQPSHAGTLRNSVAKFSASPACVTYICEPGRFREPRDPIEETFVSSDYDNQPIVSTRHASCIRHAYKARTAHGSYETGGTRKATTRFAGFRNRGGTLDVSGMLLRTAALGPTSSSTAPIYSAFRARTCWPRRSWKRSWGKVTLEPSFEKIWSYNRSPRLPS